MGNHISHRNDASVLSNLGKFWGPHHIKDADRLTENLEASLDNELGIFIACKRVDRVLIDCSPNVLSCTQCIEY